MAASSRHTPPSAARAGAVGARPAAGAAPLRVGVSESPPTDFLKLAAAYEQYPVTRRHLRGPIEGERDRYVKARLGALLAHAGIVAQGPFVRRAGSPRAALRPYRARLSAAYGLTGPQIDVLIRLREREWDQSAAEAVRTLHTARPETAPCRAGRATAPRPRVAGVRPTA